MAREAEKPIELFGLTVTCTRLKYEAAEDILPEVGEIFVGALERALQGLGALEGGIENLSLESFSDLKKVDVSKWIPVILTGWDASSVTAIIVELVEVMPSITVVVGIVLTTQTTHWFIERGFSLGGVSSLPEPKRSLYNWQRRSKVLVKNL